jgi:hypothetical protein
MSVNRRGSIAAGSTFHRQSVVTNKALQLDIDRLFSQKITVFDYSTFFGNGNGSSMSTLELITNTVLKASLKAVHETERYWTLSYDAYIQIQTDISFFKQVRN